MRKVLLVVMDGVGCTDKDFGNAVNYASTPNLDNLRSSAIFTTLKAHGTSVGLPSDDDIGNSEVGHNALGAGRIFAQGAKLVQNSIESKQMYQGKIWKQLISNVKDKRSTLHFIGLLSDGNVHSHEDHLYAMVEEALSEGVKNIRIHPLFDGRDVGETSAEIYIKKLEDKINYFSKTYPDSTVKVASGGGRMVVTMDRYEADWSVVETGWRAHVMGEAPYKFKTLEEMVSEFRSQKLVDQYFPSFVMVDEGGLPQGTINDNDSVIFFNFRGDRAIEISRAFTEKDFKGFDRRKVPDVMFAGMMQYDGDLKIPTMYLVDPPKITDSLGEYMCSLGIRQLACSETQKFGHVTYFWNGNRSGKFNQNLESYIEIPSDKIKFNERPEMKAREITDVVLKAIDQSSFDFARINYPNGDMVGHTGDFFAAVKGVEKVDEMLGELMKECKDKKIILVVTADHGNSDEMFDAKEKDWPDWRNCVDKIKPKTAHTKNLVPFYIYDGGKEKAEFELTPVQGGCLANIANTVLTLMGLPTRSMYFESLVKKK